MMRITLYIIFCFVMCFCGRSASETKSGDDPDVYRNVTEIIISKGYPVEEHCVKTPDGYLLSVQRIPYGKNKRSNAQDNGPVLIIHGLLGDATNWILNFPGQSLGFVLYDEGYDVWLLNTRGTLYSQKHINTTAKDKEFWDFSFDELARYDVPTTIDYILNITGKEDLYVIGHSQGTTASFAMLSETPEYNDKVKLLVALAPVTYLGHMTTPVRVVLPFAEEMVFFTRNGEFVPINQFSKAFREIVCREIEFCENVFFALTGEDSEQFNQTRFDVYFAHFPSSTSIKSIAHFSQLVTSKKFNKFDYGHRGNVKYYNLEEPPEYNLSNVIAPVALFWSTNDVMADADDVDLLRKQLSSLVFDYRVPYPYNHCDFFLALNSHQYIIKPIIYLFDNY